MRPFFVALTLLCVSTPCGAEGGDDYEPPPPPTPIAWSQDLRDTCDCIAFLPTSAKGVCRHYATAAGYVLLAVWAARDLPWYWRYRP